MYIHISKSIAGKNLKRQSFHRKNALYSKFNIKDINDNVTSMNMHSKFGISKIKRLYDDIHLKTDIILLAEVFETSGNKRLQITLNITFSHNTWISMTDLIKDSF